MGPKICVSFFLIVALSHAGAAPAPAQSPDAKRLLERAANAMGGLEALRALKNQVVESEGRQFNASLPLQSGAPGGAVSDFRYTLARDLRQPRLRIEWEANVYRINQPVRYVEIIDGSVGLLEQSVGGADAKQSRLHPARLATRLRDEKRAATSIVLVALGQKSLQRLPDAEMDGDRYPAVAFRDGAEEFQLHFDPKTHLPARVIILEDDPLEGDSRYMLSYGDWRKVDGVMSPFNLRYELNGKPMQEERIKSVRHNVALGSDRFAVPEAIRREPVDASPIPSQWLLRRVASNTSYQDLGRNPPVELVRLADGVYHARGTSHHSVIVEMRDHLVVVEAPLYDERSQAVIKTLKERFPGKPVRYVIPTHHHLDHSGGIRGYMAEGATIVTPQIAADFYARVARAPRTLRIDSLEKNGRAFVIESYTGQRVLTDGARVVEIHPAPTSHAEDNQVIYIPREKLLVEADHVSPRGGKVRPGPRVTELLKGIDEIRLDIATVVGIHGDTADMQTFRAAAKGGQR